MIEPRKLDFLANKNQNANYRFRRWLKMNADSEELDNKFFRLHRELFDEYDCSRCRNCCKQYHGFIPAEDIEKDAAFLNISPEEFTDKYLDVEAGPDEGSYNTKGKPCDFLQDDGTCMLGENKPESCEKYPYTDQPDRIGSLLSFLDIIAVCPVAYEIWERLKAEYKFKYEMAKAEESILTEGTISADDFEAELGLRYQEKPQSR